MAPSEPALPDRVRHAARLVAGQASQVRIDLDALDRLADRVDPSPPSLLPEERRSGPATERAMEVVTWNAVNFGSGWFPHVRKLPGLSGARTLATRWEAWCRAEGTPDARRLTDLDREAVAAVFGQRVEGEVVGLLDAFATALSELGRHLIDHHDGSALHMVEAAGGSGSALAAELATLPSWHDVHRHGDLDVPLYKRAQIVVSHLSQVLDDHPLGRFDDLDRLTAFADNLVPHVLKMHGVLVLDADLDARIEREELLRVGEAAEVELRAVAVHAVELLVGRLHDRGRVDVTAAGLDHLLWQHGQDPAIKARPRHRCRCTFY